MRWLCLTREFPLPHGYETNQHQTFYAAALQAPDGTIQTGVLKFSLPEPSLSAPFPNGLPGLSVFQLQGFEPLGKTNFLYASMVSSDEAAPGLRQYADKVRQPIKGSHSLFGDFRYKAEHEYCYATYSYLGHDVVIDFPTDIGFTYEAVVPALDKLGENFAAFVEGARLFAFDRLSHLLQQWSETQHISKDVFLATISPSSVTLYSDGRLSFVFLDGDLFGGHGIFVSALPDGTFQDAGI